MISRRHSASCGRNRQPTAYSPAAELGRLAGKKLVRHLHQDAGAVAGARIGPYRPAVLEVEQDGQRILDDLMRLASLDVGNEADAAGILVACRVIEPARRRNAGIGGVAQWPGMRIGDVALHHCSLVCDVLLARSWSAHLILAIRSDRPFSAAARHTCLPRGADRRNAPGRTIVVTSNIYATRTTGSRRLVARVGRCEACASAAAIPRTP
jgi:hypothetical protein